MAIVAAAAIRAGGSTWALVEGSPGPAGLRVGGLRFAPARVSAARARRVAEALVASPGGRAEARRLLARLRGSPGPGDLAERLRLALERGRLNLLQASEAPPLVDGGPGVAAPHGPVSPIPVKPDQPLEMSDKSLLLSHCPAEYAPRRGPMSLSYLLRELAGQAVTLSVRCPAYGGELVFEEALDAAATEDGGHEFEWDGRFAAGAEAGDRVRPELSPYRVELVHDEVYRDEAEFVVVPPTVEILAIGDHNFATDREVLLPGPSTQAEAAGDLADGLAVVAGLLIHLGALEDERELLVAGHTDAAGSAAHNLSLSERRAESLQLYLAGERDDWAGHSHDNAAVADGQEVLRWVAERFGWPCDPGPVDDEDGPKTQAGREAFRARYAHEFEGEAGAGEAFELADWQAFFDLYDQDLAARLGIDREALAEEREALSLCDPPILACGEHWPEDGLERAPVARGNRRVELLCFHPEELPEPIGGDDPPGASVYTPGAYRWQPVSPGPGPHDLRGPCLELSLALDDPKLVAEGAGLRLQGGPYDLVVAFAEAELGGGLARFEFRGLATGTSYSLRYEPPEDAGEGAALVLFEDRDLDPYIEGIGDDAAELPAIHLVSLPLLDDDEQPEDDAGETVAAPPPDNEEILARRLSPALADPFA